MYNINARNWKTRINIDILQNLDIIKGKNLNKNCAYIAYFSIRCLSDNLFMRFHRLHLKYSEQRLGSAAVADGREIIAIPL